MISEKGLLRVLKSAFKQGGYSIIPQTETADSPAGRWKKNTIILNGPTWAVRCLTMDLPEKAAVQIVSDAGYLPVEPMNIRKGEPNQLILQEMAEGRNSLLSRASATVRMRKIPVIFRERWQLYQTERGEVYAFDVELLRLVDFEAAEVDTFMTENGGLGVFAWGDYEIYIAPGRFSRANEEKIIYISGLDWENQIDTDDPVANVSLFDPDEDAPLTEQEE